MLETRTTFDIVTHCPEETMAFGRELAQQLEGPCLVLVEGELGSGKTTLVKGIAAGLGLATEDQVTSPSFTLVHEYGQGGKFYHIDLYRIEGARELATLGLEDMLDSQATVVVEWGEKLLDSGRAARIRVQMEYLGNDDRRIIVERMAA